LSRRRRNRKRWWKRALSFVSNFQEKVRENAERETLRRMMQEMGFSLDI